MNTSPRKARAVPKIRYDSNGNPVEGLLFKRFFMADMDYALKIATGTLDLTKAEFRAWHVLLAYVEKGNYVYHTRKFMAGKMDISLTHFCTAIRSLHEKDMIAYAPDNGKGPSIMVNPSLVWRGGGAEQRMAMRQYVHHRKA